MAEISDYDKTISNRKLFSQTIYIPMSEVLEVVIKINIDFQELM